MYLRFFTRWKSYENYIYMNIFSVNFFSWRQEKMSWHCNKNEWKKKIKKEKAMAYAEDNK